MRLVRRCSIREQRETRRLFNLFISFSSRTSAFWKINEDYYFYICIYLNIDCVEWPECWKWTVIFPFSISAAILMCLPPETCQFHLNRCTIQLTSVGTKNIGGKICLAFTVKIKIIPRRIMDSVNTNLKKFRAKLYSGKSHFACVSRSHKHAKASAN